MPLCLCVEAADEQDLNQSLGLIAEINAEINHLLHEKQMQLKNVRRDNAATPSKLPGKSIVGQKLRNSCHCGPVK
jgi:hypothetical protein